MREIPFNVRLIASTNRDPEEAVRSHVLLEDFYYRLQANILQVPPLKHRLEDVPLLVDYFIALFNDRLGRNIVTEGIEPQALRVMCQHNWPGNVRELANAVESAMTFGTDPLIRPEDLPPSITRLQKPRPADPPTPSANSGTFAEVERNLILRALEANEWNKTRAAETLRISRKKLYAKINKYQLDQQKECWTRGVHALPPHDSSQGTTSGPDRNTRGV